MVYNAVLKMIIKRQLPPGKVSASAKQENFISKFAQSKADELRKALHDSKAPSKKKLKVFFK